MKDMEKSLSEGGFHRDSRMAESIENVKEVAMSCERRIKEFKVQSTFALLRQSKLGQTYRPPS